MTTTPPPDSKGLLDQIRALLPKQGGPSDGDLDLDLDAGGGHGRVPYARFASVTEKLKRERERSGQLAEKVTELSQAYDSELNNIRTQAADNVKALGLRHAEDLQLVDLGIRDPLGRQAVRQAWEAQPKDGRGKSAAEWWKATLDARKAHHEDAEKHQAPSVPPTLAGYLPKLEDGGGSAGGAGGRSGGNPSTRTPPPSSPGRPQGGGLDGVVEDKGFDAFLRSLPGS